MEDLKLKRILPETFAKIIHHSNTWVRVAMQRGVLPIGTAMKLKDKSKRWNYDIRPNLAADYLGVTVEELIKLVNEIENKGNSEQV